MDNHYHLVLHTRRANLSMLMRNLNGGYTLSVIAQEVGLSVSGVSRIVTEYEKHEAKGQTWLRVASDSSSSP